MLAQVAGLLFIFQFILICLLMLICYNMPAIIAGWRHVFMIG